MAATVKESTNRLATELDRKLGSAFKPFVKGAPDGPTKDKAAKSFRAVRDRIVDEGLGKRLDALFSEFARPSGQRRQPESDEAMAGVSMLRDRGFVKTAALLFGAWRETVAKLTLEQVLTVVPDARCLQTWIKAVKESPREVQTQLLAKPAETYATAAADWLLERAKPEQLLSLLDFFLSRRERARYLPPWNVALARALKKDKRGAFLAAILRHPWPDGGRIAALADAVRSNRAAFRMTVDLLPGILGQKEGTPGAVPFVDELFGTVATTADAEREFTTGALSRLGTGLLLSDRRGPQMEGVMASIQKSVRQLRNLTRDESLQSRTWVLENLCSGDELQDSRVHISFEGARHLAVAFEKAAQGFAAKDVLSVTARNLGLSPIGKKGDVVSYNPLQHEDVEGGLIPGDTAHVEESGWAIHGEAIVRAKVKRAEGGNHVSSNCKH